MIQACAEWRGEIGAYIVGALDEDAAAAVSHHVATCPGCRSEYDDLAPVRGWLRRLAIQPGPAGLLRPPASSADGSSRCRGRSQCP
jgi:anti-sigma factor RsiW